MPVHANICTVLMKRSENFEQKLQNKCFSAQSYNTTKKIPGP